MRTFLRILVLLWASGIVLEAVIGPPSANYNISYAIGRATAQLVAVGVILHNVIRFFSTPARG